MDLIEGLQPLLLCVLAPKFTRGGPERGRVAGRLSGCGDPRVLPSDLVTRELCGGRPVTGVRNFSMLWLR